MPKEVSITCDNCHADLTDTGNMEGWRLALLTEAIPPRSGFVTAMHMIPPLKNSAYYFCCAGCLKKWVLKTLETV
jgi:hypothetical protein